MKNREKSCFFKKKKNPLFIILFYLKIAIPIDDKFEYGIWVSFAEIYTEKIYDLLMPPDKNKKRKPLSLKYEFRSGHKYIDGLKEIKVKSIEVYIVILIFLLLIIYFI